LFIEVNKIPPDGLAVDRALSPQNLTLDGAPVAQKVGLAGRLERSRGDIVFRGKVEAVVTLICSRCASPAPVPLSGEFRLVFRAGPLTKPSDEGEIDEEDLALTPFDGCRIDLNEIAREQIYLLVPLKPLCQESCRGLCPRCGSNRNLEPCGCTEDLQRADPLTLKMPL